MVSYQLFYLSFIFGLSGLEARLFNLKITLHVIVCNLNIKVIDIFTWVKWSHLQLFSTITQLSAASLI